MKTYRKKRRNTSSYSMTNRSGCCGSLSAWGGTELEKAARTGRLGSAWVETAVVSDEEGRKRRERKMNLERPTAPSQTTARP